jgi:hypothetical protein
VLCRRGARLARGLHVHALSSQLRQQLRLQLSKDLQRAAKEHVAGAVVERGRAVCAAVSVLCKSLEGGRVRLAVPCVAL